jgi:protein-tyrosine phosphatase
VIDLHCHILPGIDDGADSLETSLAMARAAVDNGITVTACTPHIYPGLYENTAQGIAKARARLQTELDARGIALQLSFGADTHLVPEVFEGLKSKRIPTLAGSRYVLLEPPHHVAPPRFEDSVFQLRAGGYVPVITHPERLTWIEERYDVFRRLALGGVWMQVTAGSLTGEFGRRPRYWGERMLDEGLVHILASDAHGPTKRGPRLAEGFAAAAARLGTAEALHLVETRPRGILDNVEPERLPSLPAHAVPAKARKRSLWDRLVGWSQGGVA